MKADELIFEVVKALVDAPDEVRIDPERGMGTLVFHVTVSKSDVGKLIGRSGRMARSLRTVVSAMGMKDGERYQLNIIEPGV